MLVRHWYWKGMYEDIIYIVGVDVMDLSMTGDGNKHMVVFQDYFTKWPMVYPVPDQKTT